jgi:hypothetical protein
VTLKDGEGAGEGNVQDDTTDTGSVGAELDDEVGDAEGVGVEV